MEDKEGKIEHLLTKNVEDVIDRKHLEAALRSGKKLRVKHGIDPTGPKIHIGRAVVLWKLREFQELGHTIVLIIGDATAQIGDPSDKLEKRPFLTKEQIATNLKDYLPQIGKVLDLAKVEVRYNSEWLAKLDFRETAQLAQTFTVQQMIERKNFKDRWRAEQEIGLQELLYPLMQGYDSVAVKADVELGGTDQLFNLLAGRKIQERYGQKPQDVFTTKMVVGLDGRKMSTSWGNVINIIDAPEDQFGKTMSINDDLIVEYFETVTDVSPEEIAGIKKELKKTNPKIIKERLALEIVKRYHGEAAAKKAQEYFEKVVSRGEAPDEMAELKLAKKKMTARDVVLAAGIATSNSAADRIVKESFHINEKAISDPRAEVALKGGDVIKIGKRGYFRVI